MLLPTLPTAIEIAEKVRKREISALEMVDRALARIQALNGPINAVVYHDAELARDQARFVDQRVARGENPGPLAGVPFTAKDLYEVAGMPSTSGTLGRASFRPTRDATTVKRLRDAGAVVLGKTNTPEFGMAIETTNLVYGTTNNPFDLERTPGGSSGGGAAAVAAGLVALEVGSDGGGSIRLPAHFCGVAGFKPTHDRVSKAGHFPGHTGIGGRLAGYGPLARTVGDLAVAFRALQGHDPRDPDSVPAFDEPQVPVEGLRVAFHTDNGICSPTPEIVAAVERCASALEKAGAIVTCARLPDLDAAYELFLALLVLDKATLALWTKAAGTEKLHPWVEAGSRYSYDAAAEFDADSATLINDDWYLYRESAADFMQDYDVLLGPAAPVPAPRHGEGAAAKNFEWTSYTSLHNLTMFPAVAFRCGTSTEGLPIGVQVAASRHRDRLALDVAALLERECGGFVAPHGFA
jgi:amidase